MPMGDLAVDEGGDGEVPGGVGGHAEAKEGPHPVVMEGWDEHCRRAAGAEDIGPCSLVEPIVYVVYIAVSKREKNNEV